MKTSASDALIIIDVQNDFCPGGALAVNEGDAVVPYINDISAHFDTVVLTQDWHPAGHSSFASSHHGLDPFASIDMDYGPQTLWPDHCIQASTGAEFHRDLNTTGAQLVIRKGFRASIDSYSAFFENDHTTSTGLTGYLRERGIQRVFCVGLATDYCVRFSAEDAVAQGFDTTVLLDGCRGIDLDGSVDAAITSMRGTGVIIS